MDFKEIQRKNKIISKIGKVENPFYPEEVTAKYLILFIDLIGLCIDSAEKTAFINHLVTHHLPTIESRQEFEERIMNQHTWLNSDLSRLVGEYAGDALGVGRDGARMLGRAVVRRHFLQMAIGEAIGLRLFYQKIAQVNKNFNSVIDIEYDNEKSNYDLIVLRKRTKPEYLRRLARDFGNDLILDALELDDQITKGILESVPQVISIENEYGKILDEPYCELRGDDFCEYHIKLERQADGVLPLVRGFVRSTLASLLFIIPMVRKMGEKLVAMEIAIQKQTRSLSDSQIQLEERVMQRTRELRKLNTHLVHTEERERKNIADKLHEGVGQELAMSRIILGQLVHDYHDEPLLEHLETIRNYIDGVIAKTRDMTDALSPPVLHELGLEAALVSLLERIEREHGIIIDFDMTTGDDPLATDCSVMIFRVAQELCVNIIKHARADRVSLKLNRTNGVVRLIITDDGIGFDPSLLEAFGSSGNSGFGLYSIKDRVGHAGGQFNLDSAPGKGCRATLTLPYPS